MHSSTAGILKGFIKTVISLFMDTFSAKVDPINTGSSHHVENITHTFWEVFNNVVVESGDQWMMEEPPDQNYTSVNVFGTN